jgi:multidrug resistance efflux pump
MTRTRIVLLAAAGIIPVVLALWIAGFDVAYQLGHYVVSDDASVLGDRVEAPAPTGGQVLDLLVEVGQPVQEGQPLASLSAGPFGAAQSAPSPRLATRVRSPSSGTVLFLNVVRGQNVSAGQAVAEVADLRSLYVVANVDETSMKSVRMGQRADVYLPALDATFPGRVTAILPVATGVTVTGAAAARQNVGTKTTASVPVKVAFDYGDAPVQIGVTAKVTIYVRE